MRIVTRYVLREHLGPLAFSLTALTSLLLLQYVARQLEKLVGKGLPWQVIIEFLVLSVPFTVAMTLPMAVLVATLHAFGRMASEHEITAFRASGVRVRTLMGPVLAGAAVLSLAMLGFNDQVLPRANHRLSRLIGDIGRTRPTLALEAQVLQEIGPGFYMRVSELDPTSNRMREVVLHDVSNPAERSTVYADSGTFAASPNGRDLEMVLYDGVQVQFPRGNAKQLQRTFFRAQSLRLRDVIGSFSASEGSGVKGDRERTICELQTEYVRVAGEYEAMRQRYIAILRENAPEGVETIRVPRPRPPVRGLASWYCQGMAWLASRGVATAEAAELPPDGFAQDTARQDSVRQDTARQDSVRQDSVLQDTARQDTARQDTARRDTARPIRAAEVRFDALGNVIIGDAPGVDSIASAVIAPVAPGGADSGDGSGDITDAPQGALQDAPANVLPDSLRPVSAVYAVDDQMLGTQLKGMSGIAVEIQKKFALSIACLVFVLFGPPIALRFPRGGVGVTIGVSLAVFGAYYVCLMAGEALADDGRLHPGVAMWAANVLFTVVGLWLVWRVERGADASRGGGLAEWWRDRRARRRILAERRAATPAVAGPGASSP